jgi:hypothetical protein
MNMKLLVLSILSMMVIARSAQASLVVTVDGNSYTLDTVYESYNSDPSLASTPWFNNLGLAEDLAIAVGAQLGTQPGDPQRTPFYVCGATGLYALAFELLNSSPATIDPIAANNYLYVTGGLTAVPEASTLYAGALMAILTGWHCARSMFRQRRLA